MAITFAIPPIPLVEHFGYVIEGEGPFAGQPTYFLRFGYCDYRCGWCDSKHAVDPEQVKNNATYMTEDQIAQLVWVETKDKPGFNLITFSGGNPAIHDLGNLVNILNATNYRIKVETQGSIWADWLGRVEHVVISPKPPSALLGSKRRTMFQHSQFEAFMDKIYKSKVAHSIKIVVFDENDLSWALKLVKKYTFKTVYLSCGTVPTDDRDALGERYAWLCESALARFSVIDGMEKLVVLPQLHVFAYLHKLGV